MIKHKHLQHVHYAHFLATLVLVFVTGLASVLQQTVPVRAGGGNTWSSSNLKLSANKTEAKADNSDYITFTVNFFVYRCNTDMLGYPYYEMLASGCDSHGGVASEFALTCSANCQQPDSTHAVVTVSGSGNTLSATTLYSDSTAAATFTLKSSVAETKTITVTNDAYGSFPLVSLSKSITFSSASSVPATTAKPKPTATTTTVAEKPSPEKLSLANLEISGTKADLAKPIRISVGKKLVLSGKTIANGIIKLFIFSEPKTAQVTADVNGNWQYEIKGLEPGDHRVEGEVTDPATNKTSERSQLMNFKVASSAQPKINQTAATAASNNKSTWLLVLGIGLMLGAVVAGVFGRRYLRRHKHSENEPRLAQESDGKVLPDVDKDNQQSDQR